MRKTSIDQYYRARELRARWDRYGSPEDEPADLDRDDEPTDERTQEVTYGMRTVQTVRLSRK